MEPRQEGRGPGKSSRHLPVVTTSHPAGAAAQEQQVTINHPAAFPQFQPFKFSPNPSPVTPSALAPKSSTLMVSV